MTFPSVYGAGLTLPIAQARKLRLREAKTRVKGLRRIQEPSAAPQALAQLTLPPCPM